MMLADIRLCDETRQDVAASGQYNTWRLRLTEAMILPRSAVQVKGFGI
jgi:hypothetical protein